MSSPQGSPCTLHSAPTRGQGGGEGREGEGRGRGGEGRGEEVERRGKGRGGGGEREGGEGRGGEGRGGRGRGEGGEEREGEGREGVVKGPIQLQQCHCTLTRSSLLITLALQYPQLMVCSGHSLAMCCSM